MTNGSGKSKTLEDTGITETLMKSGRYESLRPKLFAMDRQTQAREMRKLAAAPDYTIGSVQAVTEHGQLMVTSASGSQIGPYAAGAGQLIVIIGSQKLAPDMQTALQRVTEHVQPYEDQRLREQVGIPTLCAASSSSSATTAPAGPPSPSSVSRSGY